MNRVWVVDDAIPIHAIEARLPYPTQLSSEVVQFVMQQQARDQWEEPVVYGLCEALCVPEYDATFFRSPEAMLLALKQTASPPHVVVFDWEYPGFTIDSNRAALTELMERAFVYVQIYTQLGEEGVESRVADLRDRFNGRLLPTKGKVAVTPQRLREDITDAWEGTIAGDIADRVRREAFAAVEQTLIEFGTVPASALAAIADEKTENLLHMVFAKLRDEISGAAFETLEDGVASSASDESNEAVRRLLSVWYYYFPRDKRVRRGDIIQLSGPDDLGLVVTPACDLARFPKKTGRRLTWLSIIRLDEKGAKYLEEASINLKKVGGSIIASHEKAGDTLILLPNLPSVHGDRSKLEDHVVLCHAWNSRLYKDPPDGSELEYTSITPLKRRCTLAEPFASAVIAKVLSVISSAGTPDLPQSERNRLDGRTKEMKAAASVSTVAKAKADPATDGKPEGEKQQ